MQLYDHKFMNFNLVEDRIDFVWKSETTNMTNFDFQYSILRYASFAMEYQIKKVLIDLSSFNFTPDENSGKFHSDYVTKIYNMIGVTRKVFIAPYMESKINGKEPGTDYEHAFMASYNEGVTWLNANG